MTFALLFDRKSGTLTAAALCGVALLIFAAGLVVGAQVNWARVASRLGVTGLEPEPVQTPGPPATTTPPATSSPATSDPATSDPAASDPAAGEWVPFPKASGSASTGGR